MELRQLRSAEEFVESSIEQVVKEHKLIAKLTKKTRVAVGDVLALKDGDRAAYDTVRGLQLRARILDNMREQWPKWKKRNKHVDIRINQLKGLEQLVHFLRDDEYEFVFQQSDTSQNGTREDDDRTNPLVGYYVQPTGAGKTGLFSIEIALADVKTLVLVPFDNLMYQTEGDLRMIGGIPQKDIGVLCAGCPNDLYLRKVLVSTYAGHLARMKRDPEYRKIVQDECELVICDEGHMALGVRTQEALGEIDEMAKEEMTRAEYDAEKEVLEGNGLFMPSKAVKVAFTATPKLAAKHVRQKFGRCIGRIYQAELVEAGINVPYTIIQTDGTVLEGDQILDKMSEDEEVKILNRENVYAKLLTEYAAALKTYHDLKKGKAEPEEKPMPIYGMAFCTNHKECDKFVKDASALGLKFEILTGEELSGGEKGRKQLKAAEERLLRHEVDGFVTVEKLATGYSPNFMNTILWARVTSSARTVQAIGRGGRRHTYPGNISKTGCMVIETNWSLSKTAKKGKKLPMRLADALFDQGENPEAICGMANGQPLDVRKPMTTERAAELIKIKYTPDQWARIPAIERKGKNIAETGLGFYGIASLFGVTGNAVADVNHHLVGRAIYGESYGDPEINERERIRTLILAKYTSLQWSKLSPKERKTSNFADTGCGMFAIASKFGVEGDPANNNEVLNLLGGAIFGESYSDPRLAEQNRVRALIKGKFTPKQWVSLEAKEREGSNFCSSGMGIIRIASLFGVEGNPIAKTAIHLELGRVIFGESYGDPEAEERDRVRSLITSAYSAEEWAQMPAAQRKGKNVAGTGKGFHAIARLFGIEGDPIGYTAIHHQLGRAIWGVDWVQK